MDEWNPMLEDFCSVSFNCYDNGPDVNMPLDHLPHHNIVGSHRERTAYTLFVGNIPIEISERGIRNIFSPYGEILRYHRGPTRAAGQQSFFAFIDYATLREAKTAIQELNRKPPLNLIVSFARSKSEFAKEMDHHMHRSMPHCSAGSSFPPPNEDVLSLASRRSFHSVMDARPLGGTQGWQGGSTGSQSHLQSNLPHPSSLAMTVTSGGDERRVYSSSQHGQYYSQRTYEMEQVHSRMHQNSVYDNMHSNNHRSTQNSNVPCSVHNAPSAFHSDSCEGQNATLCNSPRQLVQSNLNQHGYVMMSEGEQRTCLYCAGQGKFLCGSCMEWYCSEDCQRRDWKAHRMTCLPKNSRTSCPSEGFQAAPRSVERASLSEGKQIKQIQPVPGGSGTQCSLQEQQADHVSSGAACLSSQEGRGTSKPPFEVNESNLTTSNGSVPRNDQSNSQRGGRQMRESNGRKSGFNKEYRPAEHHHEGNRQVRPRELKSYPYLTSSDSCRKPVSVQETRSQNASKNTVVVNGPSTLPRDRTTPLRQPPETVVKDISQGIERGSRQASHKAVPLKDSSPCANETRGVSKVRNDAKLQETAARDNCSIAVQGLMSSEGLRRAPANKLFTEKLIFQKPVQVAMCNVDSPDQLWVQTQSSALVLQDMSNKLQAKMKSVEPNGAAFAPVESEICASLFAVDNLWYRAEVKKVIKEKYDIYYVDFGNSETVPLEKLRPLPDEFLTLPAQAIPCKLANIKPAGGTWSSNSLTLFCAHLSSEMMTATLVSQEENISEIDLVANNKNVAEVLIKESFAISSVDALQQQFAKSLSVEHPVESSKSHSSAPERVETRVTSVPSALDDLQLQKEVDLLVVVPPAPGQGTFWALLLSGSYMQDLLQMEKDLQERCNGLGASDYKPQVLEIVAARSPSFDKWYRASILNIGTQGYHVHYIDYGNSEYTTDIQPLKHDEATLRSTAVYCLMNNYQSDEVSLFLSLSVGLESILNATVTAVESNNYTLALKQADQVCSMQCKPWFEAEHYRDGQDALPLPEPIAKGQLPSSCNPATAQPECQPLSQAGKIPEVVLRHDMEEFDLCNDSSECMEVTVAYAHHTVGLYLQLLSKAKQLQGMMQELNTFCNSNEWKPYSPQIDEIVCAKYSANSLWHRAHVLELTDSDSLVVNFIDYGYTEVVNLKSVRRLPESCLHFPLFGKCVLLDKVPNEALLPDVIEVLKSQPWRVVVVNEIVMPCTVTLHAEGVCVNDFLADTSGTSDGTAVTDVHSNSRSCGLDQGMAVVSK